PGGVSAPDVVAVEQILIARATNTHHLMAKPLDASGVIARAQQNNAAGEQSTQPAKARDSDDVFHQSHAPTGAGRPPTFAPACSVTAARTGAVAFGTSAVAVPNIITRMPT